MVEVTQMFLQCAHDDEGQSTGKLRSAWHFKVLMLHVDLLHPFTHLTSEFDIVFMFQQGYSTISTTLHR